MQYTYRIECQSLYAPYSFIGKSRLLFLAKFFAVREFRSFCKAHPQISLTITGRTISRHSVG